MISIRIQCLITRSHSFGSAEIGRYMLNESKDCRKKNNGLVPQAKECCPGDFYPCRCLRACVIISKSLQSNFSQSLLACSLFSVSRLWDLICRTVESSNQSKRELGFQHIKCYRMPNTLKKKLFLFYIGHPKLGYNYILNTVLLCGDDNTPHLLRLLWREMNSCAWSTWAL